MSDGVFRAGALCVNDRVRPTGNAHRHKNYFGRVSFVSNDGKWVELQSEDGGGTMRVKTGAVRRAS